TPIVRGLKERYPGLRIRFYNRAFNPIVFLNNPFVEGRDVAPAAVHGDDSNLGEGHLIEQKQRYFGLPASPEPRAEIFLSESERRWADGWLRARPGAADDPRPICVLHPTGNTHAKVIDPSFWPELVARWKGEIRFWQIGLRGQQPIEGCDAHLLGP